MFFGLTSWLVHGVPEAAGQTFTPVFAKTYVRATGTPVTVSDAFTVCDVKGAFRLIVANGPSGAGRVSSASILVNEVEVVGPQDFNQQVTRIERALTNVAPSNRLDVRLASGPAAAIRVSVEAAQSCGIRITSPAPGSTISEPFVLVRGTVPASATVGVTVNGVAGLVERDQFAALVPVDPTVTALTARASDLSGPLSTDSIAITVVAAPAETAVRLIASPPGGIAPLGVGFELSSVLGVAQVVLDADGDGIADFQGATLDGARFSYTGPGLYVPTVRVTDSQGQVHVASSLVQVSDPIALDVRLQAVWQGFKDAVKVGDLARAASFLHADTRAQYQTQLARLSPATLANIDQVMTTIQLIEVGFAGAQYEMLRLRDGQMLSFAVWFQLDADGLWRLRKF